MRLSIFASLLVLSSALNAPEAEGQNIFRKLFPVQDTTLQTPSPSIATKDPGKSKSALKKENTRLRYLIDSLQNELSGYKNELSINDSLDAEIIGMYEENEDKEAAGMDGDYQEVTDSLLSIWYVHNQLRNINEDYSYDMDSVHFSSNVPDSVLIDRITDMNSFITLPFNETVKNYIILYSEKMPSEMAKILALCKFYMPIFEETFNKYDIPEELKYMAIIESAMNPVAVSSAGAKGMWQFMYNTAKLYGLKIDSFVDERLDPVKSADAAARYLKDAYAIFGDWNLAISSYNCGAGNVSKAIRRCGGKKDFWSIYNYLPRETRGYVPAFVGAMYAVTYANKYGLVADDMQLPAHVDTFEIHRMLHFTQINEKVGVPMNMIKNLNPQYTHEIIPGNEGTFIFRVPYNYSSTFLDVEDSLYTYKAQELFSTVNINKIKSGSTGSGDRITYKVRSGDYLGRIASRYHVSVSQLKRWNHLRGTNLRVGQRLIIYRNGSAPVASSSSVSSSNSSSSSSSASANSGASYSYYTVRSGDSLYSIAKKYDGVSANDIMDFNKIGSKITPGMRIKIPKR